VEQQAGGRLGDLARSVSTLPGYQRSQLRRDLPAGLALAALLVPQGMAYATLAGLPAVTGLYTTVACLGAYALVGPSRILVLGPDSAVSPLIFAALVPLVATDDPETAIALAGMLAVLVGLMEVALGLGRFGFVASLLSKPVQIGYLNGLALVIVAGQLPGLFGFSTDATTFAGEVTAFARHVEQAHTETLLIGLGTLVVLLGAGRLPARVPGVLIAVVGATVVVNVFDLADQGVAVVGDLPQGLPRPELPWTGIEDIGPLALAAVGIVLVSLADTIAVSTAFAARRDEYVDPDREIVAVGIANAVTGLFRGFPISASSSRTAVAVEAGAGSQVAGLIGAVVVALLLVLAPGLVRDLPISALAAVVIVAAIHLVDLSTLRRLAHARPTSLVLSVAATLGVVFLGVLEGVIVAVGLSILFFFRRYWWPEEGQLGRVPGLRGWHNVERFPAAEMVPGVVLYRFEAPLFFANATVFGERVRELVRHADPPAHHVVLQCEAITDIDVTAADVLAALDRELAEQGTQLVFVELRDRLRDLLAAYDLHGDVDEGPFYRSVKEALEAITGERFDDLGLS
jgi:high affinity sulfate transporter 1